MSREFLKRLDQVDLDSFEGYEPCGSTLQGAELEGFCFDHISAISEIRKGVTHNIDTVTETFRKYRTSKYRPVVMVT